MKRIIICCDGTWNNPGQKEVSTDDGVLVSGFFDESKEDVLPEGYVMDEERRVLKRRI